MVYITKKPILKLSGFDFKGDLNIILNDTNARYYLKLIVINTELAS